MRCVSLLAIALALLIGTAAAHGSSELSKTIVYLPVVRAVPAPIAAPADIVLLVSELPSDYAFDNEALVTNEDAASNYPDSKAALQMFKEQGRELAYFRDFLHPDAFNHAVLFGEQVTRYLTPLGATAGQDAFIQRGEGYGYIPISFPPLDGRTIALRRSFTSGDATFSWYDVSVQRGRFVVEIYALLGDSDVNAMVVEDLARRASNKLVRFVPEP